MISFILLVLIILSFCIYYFVTDITKYNKISYKMIIAIILLIVVIYLKSVNL